MKKLLLVLFLAVGVTAMAAGLYKTPANIVEYGTAGDTLIASKADTAIFKVTSDYVGKMNLLLFSDAISGTAAFSSVLAGSIDQRSWVALDTITHSGGGDKLAYFALQDLIFNYYRVITTATGATQKSRLFLYGITRF